MIRKQDDLGGKVKQPIISMYIYSLKKRTFTENWTFVDQ